VTLGAGDRTGARRRLGRWRLARFRRDETGATAVEFALVAAPFLFMLFAVIELALVFVLDSALENAVMETGRLVRTGQAQAMTQTQFADSVCQRMTMFAADCPDRIAIDVRVLPRFGGQPLPDPMAGGEFSTTGLVFQTGGPRQIVVVTTWYRQPLITPMMNQVLSRLGNGIVVLTATSAFRNEPFPTAAPL
jgi:Flp pilus assembly protein TadG